MTIEELIDKTNITSVNPSLDLTKLREIKQEELLTFELSDTPLPFIYGRMKRLKEEIYMLTNAIAEIK